MKKIPLNPRLVILLTLLLFVLILGQSILEYRSSRKAVLDLMNNQAQALILSVAKASEKGLIAYEILQDKITQQLYTIVEMVDRLDRIGQLNVRELSEISQKNNLSDLLIFNSNGARAQAFEAKAAKFDSSVFKTELISDILSNKNDQISLGFINAPNIGQRCFAVAGKRSRGGVIVAAIDADELLTLRRTFGAGSVIDDISQSPGVQYAGIVKSGTLVVSSKSFPKDTLDSWYALADTTSNAIRTRLKDLSGHAEVFEAIAPFTVNGKLFGDIVIGIDTGYLNLLTAKLRRDIVWRSILFLIVAMVVLAVVILRQNYRLLSDQHAEIQKDVQRLEADKTLSAKLVAMGELAGGVAHEIRNPLNAIRVIIQRLEREFEPQNNKEEYRDFTAIIRKETDKINESVKNFLALAKPPVLHKSPVNFSASITDVLTLFQPRAQSKGCLIKSELANLPLMNLDAELMQQAILNLLENSLSAVNSSGLIEIKMYQDKNRCYLEIADNGPGIPDDEKSRVFDIYYTTKPTGTGMGLPTVLRIIKEHGGRIDLLDSELGGALFRLELPIE